MAHSLQYLVTVWFSTHTTSLKSQKSLTVTAEHSLLLPNPGADRVPLSLWQTFVFGVWCCSYRHAARCVCVCSLDLPDFVYPPKSLLAQVWRFSALGGEGATKLQFLTSCSMAAGTTHRVFPLQPIKSPYHPLCSIICTPWLPQFISAKIPLIVQVVC